MRVARTFSPFKYVFYCALLFCFGMRFAQAFDPDAAGGGGTPPVPVVGGLPAGAAAPVAAPVDNGPAILPTDVRPTSLFINKKELAKIQAAIDAYLRSRSQSEKRAEDRAKDFLNKLGENVEDVPKAPTKPVPFTYPQFYLAQISYQNDNDWVVWVNGKKFGAHLENTDSWIRFVDVNKEYVVIEWQPQNMKLVNTSWTLSPVNDADDNNISINNALDIVTFTLRQNQTFSSYAMQVVEGKLQPMHVMLVDGEPVSMAQYRIDYANQAQAPAVNIADAEEEDTSVADPNDDNTGAEALDRTYKKLGTDK